jgi:hypothetical protein
VCFEFRGSEGGLWFLPGQNAWEFAVGKPVSGQREVASCIEYKR